jgi:hypothetical protein
MFGAADGFRLYSSHCILETQRMRSHSGPHHADHALLFDKYGAVQYLARLFGKLRVLVGLQVSVIEAKIKSQSFVLQRSAGKHVDSPLIYQSLSTEAV